MRRLLTPSARGRVVIIEDDPVLLSLLDELLTTEGYQVFTHDRARDSHLLVRKVEPDVVLLDLCLATEPNRDEAGWQVLDSLVLDPATRHIPVVLASGSVESIELHRPALLPQHGVRVLPKPYDLDQLLKVLAECVPADESPRLEIEPLTTRQLEIARLIAQGCTNAEIALRLVLEPGTVANHVAHILDRLEVANRAQVAVWAARNGLVDLADRRPVNVA